MRNLVIALLLALPAAAQTDDAFVRWARGKVVPIAAAGKALDRNLGPVRLIGMGESVHETQPFGTFRRELLQDLIRRHRVTALILEAGLPDVMAVDDYVRGKTDSVNYDVALVGDLGSLVHIRDTMEWIREWNRGPGRKHPVGVYGADLPGREANLLPALDRLETLTNGNAEMKAAIDAVRPVATRIGDRWWRPATQKYEALTPEEKAAFTAQVNALIAAADRVSDPWVRRVARVAQQHETTYRLGAFSPTLPRDAAMAENITWLLGRMPAKERAVYWAHNAHVQRVPIVATKGPSGRFPSAGTRLGTTMGNAYFAIGTAYGGPARDDKKDPVPGTVDATLGLVAPHSFFLLLRGARQPWLLEDHPMRFQAGDLILPAGSAFDAIAYFDRATPAPRAPQVK